jgi:hypothetical protein
MEATELWQLAVWGGIGGLAAEVLHWYLLSRQPGGAARFARGLVYWVSTTFMIALGALIPILYIEGTASALLCFHLGAATPVILQKLMVAVPAVAQAQGGRPGLRAFYSW